MIYKYLNPDNFYVHELHPGFSTEDYLHKSNEWVEIEINDKDFSKFILLKKGCTTQDALHILGRKLGISFKRFGFAGNKDKRATTTQLCSVYGIPPAYLTSISTSTLSIPYAWPSDDPVHLGNLIGNRFYILTDKFEKGKQLINGFANMEKIPNYFGEQRFGSRIRNSAKVGMLILTNSIEDAVNYILCAPLDNEPEELADARELVKNMQYSKAFAAFPGYMRVERAILGWLKDHPTDYTNALRRLPRTTLLIYIHALQSLLFNEMICLRLKESSVEKEEGEFYCGDTFGFPDIRKKKDNGHLVCRVIGYETKPNKYEIEILNKYNLSASDFKLRHFPEISARGTYRTFYAPIVYPKVYENKISFCLQPGAYATVVIAEALGVEHYLGEWID